MLRLGILFPLIALSLTETLEVIVIRLKKESAYVETMINIGDSLGAVTAGALSFIFPIPAIFKLGALVLFPAIIIPIFIRQDT